MSNPPIMKGATVPAPGRPDLVLPLLEPPLGVVLVEPRIPPNVGATSRICAAIGAPLYLVGELTYREDHPARRRAGLDYWHLVEKHHLASFGELRERNPAGRFHLFSTHADRSLFDVSFESGDFLVFGSEDDGLPEAITDAYPEECVRIPMLRGVRSLNVTSAVAIACYEAARQVGRRAPDSGKGSDKGHRRPEMTG
ncbi:MAG: tRNA (cytidine(34)-2'-O)-methyltransferase [bacterium]